MLKPPLVCAALMARRSGAHASPSSPFSGHSRVCIFLLTLSFLDLHLIFLGCASCFVESRDSEFSLAVVLLSGYHLHSSNRGPSLPHSPLVLGGLAQSLLVSLGILGEADRLSG